MGNIGTPEIFVVLIIALLVLGPNRLPQAARSFGKAMAEFRRVTGGLQAEMRDAVSHIENELNILKDDPAPQVPPPAPYVFDPPVVPNQPGLPMAGEEVPPPVEEPLVTDDVTEIQPPVAPPVAPPEA